MTRPKDDPYLPEEYASFSTDSERFETANSNISEAVDQHLVRQLLDTLWIPSDLPMSAQTDLKERAIATLEGIAPQSVMECMLAVQMVANHYAAMECLRRVNLPNQSVK